MSETLRLLIVEDSESDTALLVRQLSRSGYAVTQRRVDNAQDMGRALQEPWDLVISDYSVPGFDAPLALEMVQKSGQDLPFIIVSGTVGEDAAVRMMKNGAHDYLLKGDLARLIPAVQRELTEARTRRERRQAEEALRESETQLRLAAQVFESSSEAILITDHERRVVRVNRAFAEITGHDVAHVLGSKLDQLSMLHGADVDHDAMWAAAQRDGFWKGELWCQRQSGERFPAWLSLTAASDGQGEIRHYIVMADDITEYKAAQARIHYLAHYDPLTDLPNRIMLRDRMIQVLLAAERLGEEVAIMAIDLDRFKIINDTLGHHAGDAVLKDVAARLKRSIRDTDTVARVGGDEFVIVLPKSGKEGAALVSRKIISAVAEPPYVVEGRSFSLTPSVGVAIFPQHGSDAETLLKNADAALYQMKSKGRSDFLLFTQPMNVVALERLTLENDLRAAVERNEMELFYQPQIDLRTGNIVALEALIRWRHRQLGLLTPGRFISLAEETGQIAHLGEWVMREACRQVKAWQDLLPAEAPVTVNVSGAQLRQPGFGQLVSSVLTDSMLDANRLELELTETMLMQRAEFASNEMRLLSKQGVRMSIDDFGTGFSNLSYLKQFPINKLKIDRSFVHDAPTNEDDAVIVRSIISLGHSLRLRVLAEGVETVEQLRFLRREQCDEAQGFYFAEPRPAEEITALLARGDRAFIQKLNASNAK